MPAVQVTMDEALHANARVLAIAKGVRLEDYLHEVIKRAVAIEGMSFYAGDVLDSSRGSSRARRLIYRFSRRSGRNRRPLS